MIGKQVQHQQAVSKSVRLVLVTYIVLFAVPMLGYLIGGILHRINIMGPIFALGQQVNACANGAVVLWKNADVWKMFMKTFRMMFYRETPPCSSAAGVQKPESAILLSEL